MHCCLPNFIITATTFLLFPLFHMPSRRLLIASACPVQGANGMNWAALASMGIGGWMREMGCGRLMISSYRWVGVRNPVSAPISIFLFMFLFVFLFWLHSCSITLYDLRSACSAPWRWRLLPGSCLLALRSFQIVSGYPASLPGVSVLFQDSFFSKLFLLLIFQ